VFVQLQALTNKVRSGMSAIIFYRQLTSMTFAPISRKALAMNSKEKCVRLTRRQNACLSRGKPRVPYPHTPSLSVRWPIGNSLHLPLSKWASPGR
jgi:hypothetical protein